MKKQKIAVRSVSSVVRARAHVATTKNATNFQSVSKGVVKRNLVGLGPIGMKRMPVVFRNVRK